MMMRRRVRRMRGRRMKVRTTEREGGDVIRGIR